MLKKENRLSCRKDFLEVKEKGRMLPSSLFSLVLLKKEDKVKQFGTIISKKISKRAVDRNKIRRLIMESLKKNWSLIEEGSRGIFLVKKKILGVSLEKIEKEVKDILGLKKN